MNNSFGHLDEWIPREKSFLINIFGHLHWFRGHRCCFTRTRRQNTFVVAGTWIQLIVRETLDRDSFRLPLIVVRIGASRYRSCGTFAACTTKNRNRNNWQTKWKLVDVVVASQNLLHLLLSSIFMGLSISIFKWHKEINMDIWAHLSFAKAGSMHKPGSVFRLVQRYFAAICGNWILCATHFVYCDSGIIVLDNVETSNAQKTVKSWKKKNYPLNWISCLFRHFHFA